MATVWDRATWALRRVKGATPGSFHWMPLFEMAETYQATLPPQVSGGKTTS